MVSGRIPAHWSHVYKTLLDSERHNFNIAAMTALDGGANIVSECVPTYRSENCRNFWITLSLSFEDFEIAAKSAIDGGVIVFPSHLSSPVQNFQHISDFPAPRIRNSSSKMSLIADSLGHPAEFQAFSVPRAP